MGRAPLTLTASVVSSCRTRSSLARLSSTAAPLARAVVAADGRALDDTPLPPVLASAAAFFFLAMLGLHWLERCNEVTAAPAGVSMRYRLFSQIMEIGRAHV